MPHYFIEFFLEFFNKANGFVEKIEKSESEKEAIRINNSLRRGTIKMMKGAGPTIDEGDESRLKQEAADAEAANLAEMKAKFVKKNEEAEEEKVEEPAVEQHANAPVNSEGLNSPSAFAEPIPE